MPNPNQPMPNQPMNKAPIYHEGFILSSLSDALSGHHS